MNLRKTFRSTSKKDTLNFTSAESATHVGPQNVTRITKNNSVSIRFKSLWSDNSITKSHGKVKFHSESACKSSSKGSNKNSLIAAIGFVIQVVQNLIHASEKILRHFIQRSIDTFGACISLNCFKARLKQPIVKIRENPSCKEPTLGTDSTNKQNINPKQTVNLEIQSGINVFAHLSCREIVLQELENSAKPMDVNEICAFVNKLVLYTGDREQIYKLVAKAIYDDISARRLNSKFERVVLDCFQISDSKHISAKSKQPVIPSSHSHHQTGTIKDAILIVLYNHDKPIHYREICQRIIKANLYEFNAIDPSKSVLTVIDREIKAFGDKSVIERVKPGWYKIRGTQSTTLGSDNQTNNINQKRKLTLYEAVIIVLEAAGEPLSGAEITNRIIISGLCTFKTSTPVKSVIAKISSRIKSEGDKSEVVRLAKGTYYLRSLLTDEQKEKIEKVKPSEFKITRELTEVIKIESEKTDKPLKLKVLTN